MLDRDVPPEAEEEAGGGAVVAHPITEAVVAVDRVVIARTKTTTAGFTPRRWITAIEPCSATATITDTKADGRARGSERPIIRRSRNPCRYGKTRTPASSPSSTICFFWPRFKRRRAR